MKRPLYLERTGWVGIGRASPQLDLFASTWRLGWWRVSVSKEGVDLIATIQAFRATAASAIATVEQRYRDAEGQ